MIVKRVDSKCTFFQSLVDQKKIRFFGFAGRKKPEGNIAARRRQAATDVHLAETHPLGDTPVYDRRFAWAPTWLEERSPSCSASCSAACPI